MPTDLKKTQGYISPNANTSARQVQELERATQSALRTVENNAPMFMGYFDSAAFLSSGSKVKIHRVSSIKNERITVNGKDPDGDAVLFKTPGYYLLNFSTSVMMQTNTSTCTLRAMVAGSAVAGCFARGISNAAANVPLFGSAIVRVPLDKPMTFVITSNTLAGSGNSDVRFSAPTLGHVPNFSLVFVRPLEDSR